MTRYYTVKNRSAMLPLSLIILNKDSIINVRIIDILMPLFQEVTNNPTCTGERSTFDSSISVFDVELVDLGAKPGCLEFLIKAGLDRIPVVAPLMMMISVFYVELF